MTVCVAARADDGSIFCASDRMITVGDIEMESPSKKAYMLTNSIVVMPSDEDAGLHMEIITRTWQAASAAIQAAPTRWPTVIEIVQMYVDAWNEMRVRLAEQTFLTPIGLTRATFVQHIGSDDESLASRIAADLVSYRMPSMSVIIAGLDPNGSHIYEVHNGELGNLTSIGYAAIGAGARHARAHLMTARQSAQTPIAETLWNTYLAKKRGQLAPGVGDETDVGMVGPTLGFSTSFSDGEAVMQKQLESVYKRTIEAEENARKSATQEMVEYVRKIGETAQAQVSAPSSPPPGGSTPSDAPQGATQGSPDHQSGA